MNLYEPKTDPLPLALDLMKDPALADACRMDCHFSGVPFTPRALWAEAWGFARAEVGGYNSIQRCIEADEYLLACAR